ncbi:MAG: TIGR02281 family clan AA aspartic protease [Pikeienuella sp.]
MLFWPFVIIATIVVTAIAASHQSLTEPQNGRETVQVVFVVALFGMVVIAMITRLMLRSRGHWIVRTMVWSGIVLLAGAAYTHRDQAGHLFDRLRGELVPSLAIAYKPGEVELRRAWDGHFRADARVNGRDIRMMVDTGSSIVMIPFERAAAIGIDPELLSFSMLVRTANGATTVAPVRLTTVQVGPIVLRDVEAAVARRGRLSTPLLGMSFLDQMRETTFRGDRMLLRHGGVEERSWVLTSDAEVNQRLYIRP